MRFVPRCPGLGAENVTMILCILFFCAGLALGRLTKRHKLICPAGMEDETGFHCQYKRKYERN